MRTLPFAFAAALLAAPGASLLSADEPPTPAPAPPEPAQEAPANLDILRWVGDLASDDFRTREAASKRLSEAGESARAALETAAKTSDSLEVRWRAEQLLLRLESPGARPLGKPGEAGPERRLGEDREVRLRGLFGAETPEAMREAFERIFREFNRGGRAFGPFAPDRDESDPFSVFSQRLVAGDLTLTLPFLGQGGVRLTVRGKDGTVVTHAGKSLEDILSAHPELSAAVGLADLQQQLAERKKRGDALTQGFRLGTVPGGSFRVQSNGVEVRQDANGALVRITEQGPDGKPVTTEYTGATLEEIKQKHPEIAKHVDGLGTFRIQIAPPRMFNGPREGGLEPLAPAAPEAPLPVPAREGFAFGLGLAPVEPVLALHLGLLEGRGVLVEHVEPGSQAAQMGFDRFDVIETIDGAPVTSREQARQVLRAAAKDKAPLTLGIIRTGKQRTLSR